MKILIANRGEIALRVLRACKELGIKAAVIFSQADRLSPHVLMAEEAHYIGPAPASLSYLKKEEIVELAKKIGADAIHPGYGFLAENPEFASLCREKRIIFIGPNPASMKLLGSKIESRREAIKNQIPIIPGTVEPIKNIEEGLKIIEEIGFPVLLKASAGGGGKGMRTINTKEEFPSHFENAQREALSYFGDPSIYIEKAIEEPKHIEVQILCDQFGNRIYLGERECSLQRRHQKILEETPSLVVDEEKRREIGEIALKVAEMAGYDSAGTVEFLRDREGNFYFLEMNTRIQVEHPITEMVTGIDLLKEQIKIAFGEKLKIKQEDIKIKGHSLECRIYAEDPLKNFAPSPGKILFLENPSGPGIRVDSGIRENFIVPLDYDPLLSKLIVWGSTREETIQRARRALDEYKIEGISTTIPFFKEILELKEFRDGTYNTGTIDKFLKEYRHKSEIEDLPFLLALSSFLYIKEREESIFPEQPLSPWRWK
ncbi:MAG: acetyl-CoA carboxylase biotin carboxylase subunit [Thermoanaerobaculia bacterium]